MFGIKVETELVKMLCLFRWIFHEKYSISSSERSQVLLPATWTF